MDVWINGAFVPEQDARVSVFDAGLQHGIGLFETMAARHGSVFRAAHHMERLAESARMLRLTEKLHVEPLISAVQQAVDHSGLADARVRLTITGGDLNTLRSTGAGPQDPTIIIVVQPPTEYPEEFFTKGVSVILASGRLNPWHATSSHKTLDYWTRISALQDAAGVGAGEALWLTPDARIACGSVSNLFWIKDGVLRTPTARPVAGNDEDTPPVRPGVTRATIMELAAVTGIQIVEHMPTLDEVIAADEVFLTNSSWHVLPVTGIGLPVRPEDDPDAPPQLGHRAIGDGGVGLITADLRAALLHCIERETSGDRT